MPQPHTCQEKARKSLPLTVQLQPRLSDLFDTTITNNVSPSYSWGSAFYTPCSLPEHLLFPLPGDADSRDLAGENTVLPSEDSDIEKEIYFQNTSRTARLVLKPRTSRSNEVLRQKHDEAMVDAGHTLIKTPSRPRCSLSPQRMKYESVPDCKLLEVFPGHLLVPHIDEGGRAPRLRLLPRTSTKAADLHDH